MAVDSRTRRRLCDLGSAFTQLAQQEPVSVRLFHRAAELAADPALDCDPSDPNFAGTSVAWIRHPIIGRNQDDVNDVTILGPAVRMVVFFGSRTSASTLRRLAERGGRILAITSPFRDQPRWRFGDQEARWWEALFVAAWSNADPLLSAERHIRVPFANGELVLPYELLSNPGYRARCKYLPAEWRTELPDQWISDIGDAARASADLCEHLVAVLSRADGPLNTAPSATANEPSDPDPFKLNNIPCLNTSNGEWVRSGMAAKMVGVKVDSLRKARGEGASSDDREVGRDSQGRVWRRGATANAHYWYLVATLTPTRQNSRRRPLGSKKNPPRER